MTAAVNNDMNSSANSDAGSETMQPLVLMMAGGTGGHIYPALAVAKELQSRNYRVEWVGTERGLEADIVPAAGLTLHKLAVRGLRGKNPQTTIANLYYLLVSLFQAVALIKRLAPDCVVSMGGYVAGPAGLAAWLWRKPLLVHEQNAVAGTTNKLLAPMAKKVLAGFPGAFKDGVGDVVVGNPVRGELLQKSTEQNYDYTSQRALRLLVLGGSLGAKPINDVIPVVVRKLRKNLGEDCIEVLHQTGAAHHGDVSHEYNRVLGDAAGNGITVKAFIDDMAAAYSWADLVLCRAGALTVSELAIMARPSILVPLPHAIDDHQTANARSLSNPGGALLITQENFNKSELYKALQGYIAHPKRLPVMAKAAASVAQQEATSLVSDHCEELINER